MDGDVPRDQRRRVEAGPCDDAGLVENDSDRQVPPDWRPVELEPHGIVLQLGVDELREMLFDLHTVEQVSN